MSAKDHDPTYTDKVNYVESNAAPPHQALQRQLKNRHVAMIRYLRLFSRLVRTFVERFLFTHLVLEVRDHRETICS